MRIDREQRTELISLVRGLYAGPILASFTELGVVERLLEGPFRLCELRLENVAAVAASFAYLESIGVVELIGNGEYQATSLGQFILDRRGIFQLLHSYRAYFEDFELLLDNANERRTVDRLENVKASGQLHSRRYFPLALEWIARRQPEWLVDLGCGNGEFLAAVHQALPRCGTAGIDLSHEAVTVTRQRFQILEQEERFVGLEASAAEVSKWRNVLPQNCGAVIISLWFVLHEFAERDTNRVVEFFEKLHVALPGACVVVGEIVSLPPRSLAPVKNHSIYPEMLLFHALSGQGVLSWEQHQDWLSRVPYRLEDRAEFGWVKLDDGEAPSSFVWHLSPNEDDTASMP